MKKHAQTHGMSLEKEIANVMSYIRVHRNDVPADVRESMDRIEQHLDSRPPEKL